MRRLTQTGRLCLIGHSEGVPPDSDLCWHTNYQSASARTLHWHRGIAALSEAEPGPAGWARELSVANRHFFFCAVRSDRTAGDRRRVWAPTVPQLARGPRGSTVLPGRRQRNHPPATPSPLLARQVRRRCATRPRRSALVDSGACSIRSGARVQLGMRKGDHDMVHGLACMRGCSLVVQRVERGANFKNRV